MTIPANLVTNELCGNCVGLYPFGWQACIESQKLTEATVGIWLTSF